MNLDSNGSHLAYSLTSSKKHESFQTGQEPIPGAQFRELAAVAEKNHDQDSDVQTLKWNLTINVEDDQSSYHFEK